MQINIYIILLLYQLGSVYLFGVILIVNHSLTTGCAISHGGVIFIIKVIWLYCGKGKRITELQLVELSL
jgi:hypothetical protein